MELRLRLANNILAIMIFALPLKIWTNLSPKQREIQINIIVIISILVLIGLVAIYLLN